MLYVCNHFIYICIFFFFSSRRRHTRSLCDWSSDVCSSDLQAQPLTKVNAPAGALRSSARSMGRSEEHTSELQSHSDLVCRLLLENKRAHVCTPVTQGSSLPSSARNTESAGAARS